jgi:hypothetical protein
MKRFFAYLLAIFMPAYICTSQGVLLMDYKHFVNSVNFFADGAVYIETPTGGGTGTFIDIPFPDNKEVGAMFVATARHLVIKNIDTVKNIVYFYDTVNVAMQVRGGTVDTRKYKLLKVYPNLDVAILIPLEKFRSFNEYKQAHANPEDIATNSDLMIGQTVIMAGFPFKLGYSKSGLMPVVQNGIIAQVDTATSQVIIDIPVNYGNSGGPVYTWNLNGEVKLVGLVFAYEPNPQDYVYSKTHKANIESNSSLGKVVLLSTIIKDLKDLTKK